MAFNSQAQVEDFLFDEGDDQTFNITREDENGNAIDITGWTFWLTIKDDPEDTDANAVVQKTVTNHTTPTNGKTQINLTNSDTADLQQGYYYDMQYKTNTGTIKTFLHGSMYFRPDVTESTS